MDLWILIAISLAELFLFFMLLRFFSRLRKSEELLTQLQGGQNSLMDKLRTNAELEQDLMRSFTTRQIELENLNNHVEARSQELKNLLEQAGAITRSPQFLRELISTGKKKGRSSQELAKATGLSVDEVELILAQTGN